MNSDQTTTSVESNEVTFIDFPVIFKVFMKPAFDMEILKEAGYPTLSHYFLGITGSTGSVAFIGWNGVGEFAEQNLTVSGDKNIITFLE